MKIVASYVILTSLFSGRPLAAQSLTIDTVAAAPACLVSGSDTTDWNMFDGREVGVSVRLPASFHEKRYDVTVGNSHFQEWRDNPFTSFAIERGAGPDSLVSAAIVRQSTYKNYTECRIEISNHPAIVQSMRGGGTIFSDGKEYASYNVYAAVQLAPGQYLRVRASTSTRRSQEIFLIALRTIVIRDQVPP